MPLFKWSKAHAVFIAEIDDEHKALFRMGRELEQALDEGTGAAELQPRIQALAEQIGAHFDHEERIMRDSRCPSYDWHKSQHNAARRRVQGFLAEIEASDANAPLLLLEYLDGWLRDHTALTDRMMAAHVRNHLRTNTRLAS